jgi:hypothetical protein
VWRFSSSSSSSNMHSCCSGNVSVAPGHPEKQQHHSEHERSEEKQLRDASGCAIAEHTLAHPCKFPYFPCPFEKLSLSYDHDDEVARTDGQQPHAGRHGFHGHGRLRVPKWQKQKGELVDCASVDTHRSSWLLQLLTHANSLPVGDVSTSPMVMMMYLMKVHGRRVNKRNNRKSAAKRALTAGSAT